MRLGICTRYSQHEATYAAVRIADLGEQRGYDVTLYAVRPQPRPLGLSWDTRLQTPKTQLFSDWAAHCDYVIWTHVPHIEQVRWLRYRRIPSAIFVLWQELAPEDAPALKGVNKLICPSRACYDYLRTLAGNAVYAPWDPGLPCYTKCCPTDECRLLLPLWDGETRRTEMTVLKLLERSLRQDGVSATVAYNSSTVGSRASRQLRRLAREFSHLTLRRNVRYGDRPFLIQQHDLVLWPTHYENTCMLAVMARAMGTPVIGFRFRPTDEVLTDGAVAIPPQAEIEDAMGIPTIEPDYYEMDRQLQRHVQCPQRVQELQQKTHVGLQARRALFEAALSMLWR